MVTINTEFVLMVENGLLYEDVYFTHDKSGWASEKKPSFSWKIFTPELDPNDLPTNVTGGYVIGAFDVARAGDLSPFAEYRLIHEYAYDQDPEIHFCELAGDPNQLGESYEVRNFRFGHSYGNLDEVSLQEFEDWITHIPGAVVLGSEPFLYELNWEGLLPYPEGEIFEEIPPAGLGLGFNEEITNNTGQDAYDFHLEGRIESETLPVQVMDIFGWPESSIPYHDWTYDGGKITPVGGKYYDYSGSWSGSVPVPPGQQVHIGKKFIVNCSNVCINLRGWWTDRNGRKINPNAGTEVGHGVWVSDVLLLGFDIQDNIPARLTDPNLPQTVTLQNATDMEIEIVSPCLAVTDMRVPLEELVPDSNLLNNLEWRDIPSLPPFSIIPPGESWTFNLRDMDMVIPPDWTTVIRTEIWDPVSGEYHFYAGKCQAHSARVPFDPVIDDLVAYYALDGDALDSSGNGNDGVIIGDSSFTEGVVNQAMMFDGAGNQCVDCGTFNPSETTGQISIAAWINWNGLSGQWQGILAKRAGWDTGMMWYLEAHMDTGAIRFSTRGNYPFDGLEGYENIPPVGEWYHTAATFDGTTASIYANGVLMASVDTFAFGDMTDANVLIGCADPGCGNPFNGLIDEVYIYDRALSQDEILLLAQ
jgi:hypothetical protein